MMFVLFHLVGLPVVLLGEVCKFVPESIRPLVTEWSIVAITVFGSFYLLSKPVALSVLVFFGVMYLLRLLFWKAWVPGEPEEVSK